MPSKSVESFGISDGQIREYFTSTYDKQTHINLHKLFEIAMNDKNLFPNVNLANGSTYKDFINRWAKSYIDADRNPAHTRNASPKGSCNDPAVKAIVKMVTQVSDEDATAQETHHNLFMSAENIQGALLEEYIDSVISEHGWVWCKGNTLRAVDFCTTDGSHLLQIKNKFNSENSSSSNIRSGTDIKKWFRLGVQSVAGKKMPVYKWDVLNAIISNTSGKPCHLCEKDYIKYVEDVATNNPNIITDK